MEKNVLKLIIVGSVDHGKSTLIGRLLYDTNSLPEEKIEEMKKASGDLNRQNEFAFLLDHLKEERELGITIDTTQIFFETEERRYVIIDAPGHVEFVKNMITGASQAEAAILIVDAKEGIKEQTKRHANILSMLGIKQILVAINKIDLADNPEESFNKIKNELEQLLVKIGINPSYYIPISALKGDNVFKKADNYKGVTIMEALSSFKEKPSLSERSFIFPVQDIYKAGDKRIIAGRIESGRIREGEEVIILPAKQKTFIKTIERFQEERKEAEAGESIGIAFDSPFFIERGNVICKKEDDVIISDNIFANIFWMSQEELKEKEIISLKCSTQEVMAEISEIKKRVDSSSWEVLEENAEKIKNLEIGEVVIKTRKPIIMTRFKDIEELGRFVLVKDENIVAGGIIL